MLVWSGTSSVAFEVARLLIRYLRLGATSVGWYAIQIAKLLGLRVLATASKKNWAVLKDLGVEKCFDYKDEDVVEQIKAYAKDSIAFGVDNICLNGGLQLFLKAFPYLIVCKQKVLRKVSNVSVPKVVFSFP